MNKYKFLTTVIIGLLISNLTLLFILFKHNNRNGGPKNIIIEKLHFDKEQINNYELYIQKHRNAINDNENAMNKLRINLYKELNYSNNDTKIDSLIAIIGTQQIKAEKVNYNHFLEIKNLCKPSQQKYFTELTNEIGNLFYPNERK